MENFDKKRDKDKNVLGKIFKQYTNTQDKIRFTKLLNLNKKFGKYI